MCGKVGYYVSDCRYRKKIVEGNVGTLNDQESTSSKEEWDVEASFAIIENWQIVSISLRRSLMKVKQSWQVALMSLMRSSMSASRLGINFYCDKGRWGSKLEQWRKSWLF